MRVSRIGCLASIVISVVLSVTLTAISNLIIQSGLPPRRPHWFDHGPTVKATPTTTAAGETVLH